MKKKNIFTFCFILIGYTSLYAQSNKDTMIRVYSAPTNHTPPPKKSQSIQYSSKSRAIVKAKLDSLYPHAKSRVAYYDKYASDTTIEIQIANCNCTETNDMIILVFDTNGNLLNKEVHYYGSLDGLPDTILSYIKKTESSTAQFDKKNWIKYYNNKGKISYGIYLGQYILKFKGNGEFISKEAIQGIEL